MWDKGSDHGVLFLSRHPGEVAVRLRPWDVCAVFNDMLRCLIYAHCVRRYYPEWRREIERATGVRPCGKRAAARRNEAQCAWTAATYSNYGWICLAALDLVRMYGHVLSKSARAVLGWLTTRVPFSPEIALPTMFPPPPDKNEFAPYESLRDATRDARRYYRSLQPQWNKSSRRCTSKRK